MPWMHMMVKPNSLVKPCCRFNVTTAKDMKLYLGELTPKEVMHSDEFKKLREKMLDGEKIDACYNCYAEEEVTGNSMRLHMSKKFGAVDGKFDTDIKIRYLELTFGNYCNLACRTCNSYLSTTWHDDDAQLEKIPELNDREAQEQRFNVPFNWSVKDFDAVEEIKFTGGEPMLHPNFMKLLDLIIQGNNHEHIRLDIYTNASWKPKKKLLDKLAKFHTVNINFSIDGVGKTNDYVRHHSDWDDVVESVSAWLDLERENHQITTVMCTTFNILNAHNIEDLIDWWVNIRRDAQVEYTPGTKAGDTILILLQDPDYLHIKHHPNLYGEISKLQEYLSRTTYESDVEKSVAHKFVKRAIQIMNKYAESDSDISKFWTFNDALDKIRNQTLREALPEVYDKLKQKQ